MGGESERGYEGADKGGYGYRDAFMDSVFYPKSNEREKKKKNFRGIDKNHKSLKRKIELRTNRGIEEGRGGA